MLRYVTTNPGKAEEAREYLRDVVEGVEAVGYDYPEVQAADLATIAARGAEAAYDGAPGEGPVIVDDAGLFVRALGGFPGPYSAYVEDTLGVERVSRLAREEEDRHAAFRVAIGYCDGETTETFEGAIQGRIVAPRGEGGFGYDPIFEHDGRTLAEMSTEEKNAVSHRGRGLAKLASWLADEPATNRGAR